MIDINNIDFVNDFDDDVRRAEKYISKTPVKLSGYKDNYDHIPTPEMRALVRECAGIGLPVHQISSLVGVNSNVLRDYYHDDIIKGVSNINRDIANALYKKAIDGDTRALIWWTQARMGWSNTIKHTVEPTKPTIDVSRLSNTALLELVNVAQQDAKS